MEQQMTTTFAPFAAKNFSQNPNTVPVNIEWVLEGHKRAEEQGLSILAPVALPVDKQPRKRKKMTRAQIRASKGQRNMEPKKGKKK